MAVNSKADKTGGHKSSGLKMPSYSQGPAAPVAAGVVVGAAGTKALASRARKILGPIEDPTKTLAD